MKILGSLSFKTFSKEIFCFMILMLSQGAMFFLNLDDGRWVAPITITSLCFYRVSQSNSFLRVFHYNGIVYHITLFRYLLKKISFYLTKQIKKLKIRFTSYYYLFAVLFNEERNH